MQQPTSVRCIPGRVWGLISTVQEENEIKTLLLLVSLLLVWYLCQERDRRRCNPAREGQQERRKAMRKGWHNKRGGRDKRGAE